MEILGVNVAGASPSYNAHLPSGTTELSFEAFINKVLDLDTTVTFNVTKAVYTKGHQLPSSVAVVDTMTFTHSTTPLVTLNMTHYPVKEVYLEEIRINATHNNYTTAERTHYVAHDWANEYALILITTDSQHYVYAGSPTTSIYVTGASQSSPSTQEEGVLRLPTALTLSLGQATVGEDAGAVNVTATLDAPAPPEGASVSLYSSGGTATEGTDYTMPTSINIPAGERSGSASITITDDAVAESDESVSISAYVDIFGQEMTDSITLTITDNDGAGVVVD